MLKYDDLFRCRHDTAPGSDLCCGCISLTLRFIHLCLQLLSYSCLFVAIGDLLLILLSLVLFEFLCHPAAGLLFVAGLHFLKHPTSQFDQLCAH